MSNRSAASDFRATLESLRDYFAAEPSAVSVATERFGALSRDDVARLLPMAIDAEQALEARALGVALTPYGALVADVLTPAFDLMGAR